jgi:tetratricopeptide (TPR) repeat protein
MSPRRLLTLGTVAALAAAVLLFGGVFRSEAAPGGEVGETPGELAAAGLVYQQRARETGDAAYLTKAEQVFRQALALDPREPTATEGMAALALSRHEFGEALRIARRAQKLSPGSTRPVALVGDALVELGRYDEAFAAYDVLGSRKPGLGAYSRIAYARELIGDRAGAIEAMRLAVAAAPVRGEPAAWARVELAKLYFGQGDIAEARREYRSALRAFPGYVYGLDGLAHVEAARGDLPKAIELAAAAAARVPLPQFVVTLAELYRSAGRHADAAHQYGLLRTIKRLLGVNGVRTELELALADIDRGAELANALERARSAHARRPSIQADDTLAWALARNGHCGAARAWSKRSLRLGTRDAMLFFHRGMIERCLGNREHARRWFRRALDLNPHFSLRWSPLARRSA